MSTSTTNTPVHQDFTYPSQRPLFSVPLPEHIGKFPDSQLVPVLTLNPKPDPSIPVVALPPIPQELAGPQNQVLLYGYTYDNTTAKKLGLSFSYEITFDLNEQLYRLNLQGYYKVFGHGIRDDLYLYYFAVKFPGAECWTRNDKGTIPSDELMDQVSQILDVKPRWFGYEDVTRGPGRHPIIWKIMNPMMKDDEDYDD